MWQMGIGPPYAKLYIQLIYDYLIYDYLNTNVSYPNIARMKHIDVANYMCTPSIGTYGGI